MREKRIRQRNVNEILSGSEVESEGVVSKEPIPFSELSRQRACSRRNSLGPSPSQGKGHKYAHLTFHKWNLFKGWITLSLLKYFEFRLNDLLILFKNFFVNSFS